VESLFLAAVVVATSLLAVRLARRTGRLAPGRWAVAWRRALEVLGLGVAFFALNVLVGVAAVLLVRGATGAFLSAYLVNDVSLVALSLLQGLVFAGLLRPAAGARSRPRRARVAGRGRLDGGRPSV
jgi:hypothetical protein